MSEMPEPTAIYDIEKTYLENAQKGPFFEGITPPRNMPDKQDWIDFLGFKIASPIGIPAGPLLNSKWIELSANLGFDILTYKTIRSHAHSSHPLPNVVPITTQGPLLPGHLPEYVMQNAHPKNLSLENLGITNSFGNPSFPPEYLQKDIPLANSTLREGQVMIVSIFGTSHNGVDIVDDFADTALFAKECGAQIIEANYSCPNVADDEGSLYSSPDAVYEFSSRIVKAIGDTPLIIKVGAFPDISCMKQTFLAAAKAGVHAICGLNTVSMKVFNKNMQPALGPNRITCGICGTPIHEAALEFTRQARKIIDQEKLDLTLLATGGATRPHHLQEFLDEGADIAMTATGMMWDPYLAMRFHDGE
ncbi:MAG: NAD-dependent dihydropyrimidine dehydrogenase subunit PreA [Chlamydiae bacterium]|nr:NAD-dependent dihydropyrimidine dehydrogenase subunit PreA [Chlamydiota bacterium]